MPSISSGELFFRTRGEMTGSWLHNSLGSELKDFLGVGTAEVNDKNFFAQQKMLEQAEKLSLSCHQSMCRGLELHTVSAEQLCKSFLSRAKTTDSGFRLGMHELLEEYDERCGHLALWYYSALEREQETYRRRMEEESLSCNRLSMQVKESLRLSVFAIHLESETDSQILLKRLPPAHPQHVRCRRAASENIKPGFFNGASPFSGINVLDVYKVENAPELDRFQKRAAAMEPGKVKGLFTSVTGTAIERIIALGMGGERDGRGGGGPTSPNKRRSPKSNNTKDNNSGHLFRRAWYAYHNNKSEVGYAENRIRKSAVCQFPRSFSRYSTLEADRSAIEEAAELERKGIRPVATEDTNTTNSTKKTDISKGTKGTKGTKKSTGPNGTTTEDARDGGGPVNDDIRYLVLCRVAVGKVFVTSKEYRGFPSVGTDPAFDSMYNPLQEEYLVLRPHQVLPEFVIQYVLKKNPAAVTSATSTTSTNSSNSSTSPSSPSSPSFKTTLGGSTGDVPLIPIDLSSPHVVLPQADVAWRIGIASMSDVKSKNKNEMNLIAPTPMTTPRTRLPNAWSVNAMEGKKANNATTVNNTDLPSDVSAAVRTAEIARREQLTSWEQLRLNAARQRETILERTQGLNTVYRQLNSKLRVRTLRGEEHKKNSFVLKSFICFFNFFFFVFLLFFFFGSFLFFFF